MSARQLQFDPEEELALTATYGPTEVREHRFDLDPVGFRLWWRSTALRRRAEVVMIVQRPDGRLLLHAKAHYPPDIFRLPTGGVQWGETVLEALAREQSEELGFSLPPESMPGLIRYALHYDDQTLRFASYLFRLRSEKDLRLSPRDPAEAIAEFHWLDPRDLPGVAQSLRDSSHGWHNWGAWRAVAHDLMAECCQL
jgi:8-oxo-dGTP pyrophosphatase MutT (NUDIX family)